MKNILATLTESEKRRILESHRLGSISKKLNEASEMCSAENQKPSLDRPACQKGQSGMLLAFENTGYIQYNDESGCPTLCKVEDKSIVTLS